MIEYDIKEGLTPVVYEVGVGEEQVSLLIRAHQKAVAYAESKLGKAGLPLVTSLQRRLKLAEFIPPSFESWGFGEVLRRKDTVSPDWTVWECRLPGAVGEMDIDWKQLDNVAASLEALFFTLGMVEGDCQVKLPQLMHFLVSEMEEMQRWSLNVYLAKAFSLWLNKQPDYSFYQGTEEVMRMAYGHLTYDRGNLAESRSFKVRFTQPCGLNLSVPGNSAGLDPEDYYNPKLEGYELLPHNIDSPVQVLTCIMGMAKLHDEARKAGY